MAHQAKKDRQGRAKKDPLQGRHLQSPREHRTEDLLEVILEDHQVFTPEDLMGDRMEDPMVDPMVVHMGAHTVDHMGVWADLILT